MLNSLLSLSFLVAIVVFLVILRFLPSGVLWNTLTLKEAETLQVGFSSSHDYSSYFGKEGVVRTLLRPTGSMLIDGIQIDVISEGQYIEPGTKVRVVSIEGNRIVVRIVSK